VSVVKRVVRRKDRNWGESGRKKTFDRAEQEVEVRSVRGEGVRSGGGPEEDAQMQKGRERERERERSQGSQQKQKSGNKKSNESSRKGERRREKERYMARGVLRDFRSISMIVLV
jgi:hypothetical protein